MAYTSSFFLLFLVFFIYIYWTVPNYLQKYLILVFSLYFISSFSLNSLYWILGISLLSFFVSLSRHRILKLVATIFILSSFMYLKFANYFIYNINNILNLSISSLSIMMPIGFSFYMIQNIMYIWNSNQKYESEKNFFKYLSYISYFPTVVQGPITKYQNISNEIWNSHVFDNNKFSRGFKLLVLGLFKKMIVSGRAAMIADTIFSSQTSQSGLMVLIGAIAYSLQLYMDFSAAVDICRGISYMLGITLPINFNKPYFSLTIKDFWRRWHITLSSFFTEFIYFPLGGSRVSRLRKYLNILVVFLVSGIWHGVGINFILWGLLHAFYQIFGDVTLNYRKKIKTALTRDNLYLQKVISFFSWLTNMTLIMISWILFRANGLSHVKLLLNDLISLNPVVLNSITLGISKMNFIILVISSILIFYLEYKNSSIVSQYPLIIEKNNYILMYITIIVVLIFGIYGSGYNSSDFIYMGF